MAVEIYRPNPELLAKMAQEALREEENRKKKSSSGGKRGDITWGNIQVGDNFIRVLPSTNSRGTISKRVRKHFFPGDLAAIAGEKAIRCISGTHDDVEGSRCPICDRGDSILAKYPQLDIKRWHIPSNDSYVQAYFINESEHTARVTKITPRVDNWINVNRHKIMTDHGIDITDETRGTTINIVKKVTGSGDKKKTSYEPTFWSPNGPSPLHSDPAVVQKILESMIRLDDLWKYPNDESLAKIHKAAGDLETHYARKQMASTSTSVQVPGVSAVPTAPVQTPAVQTQVMQTPATQAPVATQTITAQSVAPQAVQVNPALQVVQSAVATAATLPLIPTGSAPADKPKCFGGASPRSDGGTGYDMDVEECLLCPHEMPCHDACKAAGIGVA